VTEKLLAIFTSGLISTEIHKGNNERLNWRDCVCTLFVVDRCWSLGSSGFTAEGMARDCVDYFANERLKWNPGRRMCSI